MSGRWFRFYADAMRNPKVARLSDKEFRLWVELLAVAAENEGIIPPMEDLKHLLKRRLDHLSTGVERLLNLSLIDVLDNGYEPHNWKKFQYKSDVSTDRVKKHRDKRNVSETPPDTDTDTEQKEREEEAKASPSSARVKSDPFPKPDWAEDQVWSDFLVNRKRKKLPNTASAHKGFLQDIAQHTDDDWPPGLLLGHAAAKGWGGIYDPKENRNGQSKSQIALAPNGNPMGRTESAARSLLAEIARRE